MKSVRAIGEYLVHSIVGISGPFDCFDRESSHHCQLLQFRANRCSMIAAFGLWELDGATNIASAEAQLHVCQRRGVDEIRATCATGGRIEQIEAGKAEVLTGGALRRLEGSRFHLLLLRSSAHADSATNSIIPQSTSEEDLAQIVDEYALDADFQVNDLEHWMPAHAQM